MHTGISGLGDYLAEDDRHAIGLARDIMAGIDWSHEDEPRDFEAPAYDSSELLGIMPEDYRQPVDMREVIARVVDGSGFTEFGARYGSATVCGNARIAGWPIGIITNNGPIDPAGASKATHFIQTCCQAGTPILYLNNTTGYMVGRSYEEAGMIKHGSKMIQAVANCRVPKIAIVIGGSYGPGNYAMFGRGLDPRFIFAWPNSRTAVMGPAQAGKVMRIVAEDKQRRGGMEPDPKTLDFLEQATAKKLEDGSTALYGTARLWDDGLIDPRDTRRVLALVLSVCREADARPLRPNSFGVARL